MKKFTLLGFILALSVLLTGLAVSVRADDGPAVDGFADVPSNAWYAEAVAYVQEKGLMNGNTTTEFAPNESLTRAMLVTVLYRLENEPQVVGDDGFSDTAAGQWYSNAVLWATKQGVVNGYGNGLFGPDDNITQEQLKLIMGRYVSEEATQNIPGFTGSTAPATRAQVAAALLNLSLLTNSNQQETTNLMYIHVDGAKQAVWTATLADNSSATALKELLQKDDISLALHDYSNFEKVGPLGSSLPTNDEQITTEAGDLILYQGNQFVMYYASNSWSFTRLGKINGVSQSEMQEVLGQGNVNITLSLTNPETTKNPQNSANAAAPARPLL